MVYDNLSALNAFSGGIALSSHNIANISTANYTPVEYHYGAGYGGNVQLQVDPNPPQLILAGQTSQLPSTQNPLQNEILGMANNTVDLAREFTSQISTQRAFEANAIAITTRSEMESSLYNDLYEPALVSYRV